MISSTLDAHAVGGNLKSSGKTVRGVGVVTFRLLRTIFTSQHCTDMDSLVAFLARRRNQTSQFHRKSNSPIESFPIPFSPVEFCNRSFRSFAE